MTTDIERISVCLLLLCSGQFDRQDSLRSDYLSDRETRYGIVQQASIDSTDSRLCYLTSSEVSARSFVHICPHQRALRMDVVQIKYELSHTLIGTIVIATQNTH